MRTVIPAVLALLAILCGDASGEPLCTYSSSLVQDSSGFSTFRGISLASRPQDVRRLARAIGIDAYTSLYVGSHSEIASINMYKRRHQIGGAHFDRHGTMLRLSLKDRFFCDAPIFVRRFADDVFEHYGVKPLRVDDDVCFQDVTCFKGVSKFGEQFLILRIGTDAELYVRR